MSKKQSICIIAAIVMFIIAAGMVETRPLISFLLITAISVPFMIGRLEKKRVTCEDIERRCSNAKN